MKHILTFVGIWFLIIIFFLLVGWFINVSEQEDCARLTHQSKEGYADFYITQNEAKMCSVHGTPIDAPIK